MNDHDAQIIIELLKRIERRNELSQKTKKEQNKEFVLLRADFNALHKRVDKHEEALVGNVTTKVLHRWLLGTAGTITAAGVIFTALWKVFIK